MSQTSGPKLIGRTVFKNDKYKVKKLWEWDGASYDSEYPYEFVKARVYDSDGGGKLYALVSPDGKNATDAVYADAHMFKGGCISAYRDGEGWGLLNAEFNPVTPFKYEGIRRVGDKFMAKDTNGNYFLINKDGEAQQNFFEDLLSADGVTKLLPNLLRIVRTSDGADAKYGCINTDGSTAIPAVYDSLESRDGELFIAKLSDPARVGNKYPGVFYGLLDKSGNEVAPFIYPDMYYGSGDAIYAIDEYGGQRPIDEWEYPDVCSEYIEYDLSSGKDGMHLIVDTVESYLSDYVDRGDESPDDEAETFFDGEQDGQSESRIDENSDAEQSDGDSEEIVDVSKASDDEYYDEYYDDAYSDSDAEYYMYETFYDENRDEISDNTTYYHVYYGIYDDIKKDVLLRPQFNAIEFLPGGDIYAERFDEQKGIVAEVMDRGGNPRFDSPYTRINTGSEPYEAVITGEDGTGKHGLISRDGSVIMPVIYDAPDNADNRLGNDRFRIMQGALMGVADYGGNLVVQPKYSQLDGVINGDGACEFYVARESGGKEAFVLLNRDGERALPGSHDKIDPMPDGVHFLTQNGAKTVMYGVTDLTTP